MPELLEQTSERLVIKAYTSPAIDPLVEPVPATDPATSGGQVLRYVSHNLSLAKEAFTDDEIRTDQQRPMEKHGTKRVNGTINGLMSCLTHRDLYAAVLGADWSVSAVAGDETDFTSVAADSVTSKFTFGSGDPVAEGFRVGDVIRFSGLSVAGNNGVNFVVLGFGGTSNREVTVYPAPTTHIADEEFDVTTVGRSIFMPASGHVKRKFAVEVYNSDGDISRLFTEGRFSGFAMSLAPNRNATVDFNGMWRNRRVYDGGDAPFFSAPTAQTTTEVISAMDGLLCMDGEIVGVVTGLTINFTRAPTGPAAIHPKGLVPGILLANAVVTGDFTVFLQDRTFLDAFNDQTEFSIVAFLPADATGAGDAMTVTLPRVKVNSNNETNVEGAKAIQCGFTAARYFGAAPGLVSSVIRIVDTAVS